MQLFFGVAERFLRYRQQPVQRLSALLTSAARLDTERICDQFDSVASASNWAFVRRAARALSTGGPTTNTHTVCVNAHRKFDVSADSHVS